MNSGDGGNSGHGGDLDETLAHSDGLRSDGEHGDGISADPSAAGLAMRRPLHSRARIEGIEAGVAAGLVPAGGGSEGDPTLAGWETDEGSSDGLDPAGNDVWIDYDGAGTARPPATSPVLPDWRDPPTREVPRVLLDHPQADQGPSYPGPVWREVETDWDDDDLTFAEIVHEGASVADHGLSINEPDPFSFDLEIESVSGTTSQVQPPPEPDAWDGSPEPSDDRDAPAPVEVHTSGLGASVDDEEEDVPPARASTSRRASRASHRAQVTFAGRARHERRPVPVAPSAGRPAAPAHSPAVAPTSSRRNPVVATVTGLAAGIAVMLIFLAGPQAVLALVTLVLVMAAAECYHSMRRARYRPAVPLGLLAVAAVAIFSYLKGPQAIPLVGAALVITTLCWFLFGVSRRSPVANISATLMGWMWIGLLGGFATLLIDPRTFPHRHGLAYFFGAIVGTVAYDVGGYAFGSWIGKRRLAPSISPNKTMEGLVGGCFAAVSISVAVVSHIHPWTVYHALELGIVVAVFAPLGDLAESMIKRDIGVKDMGSLLPAHGGMLDRVDALLFVLPATYCLVRLFHG
jgi:phosphatidate cytidylyltransferase